MKALKTIVAAGAIVFTAATVALAGVHAVTQNANAQANPIASHQALTAQKYYTVAVSAKDLQRLLRMMNGQKAGFRHTATGMRTGFAVYRTGGKQAGRNPGGSVRYMTTRRCNSGSGYRCLWYGTHSATRSGYSGSTWPSGGGNGCRW
jgi:hypothetical protein